MIRAISEKLLLKNVQIIIPDKGEFKENIGHWTKKLSEYQFRIGTVLEQDIYKLQNIIRLDQKFVILVLGRNASDFFIKVYHNIILTLNLIYILYLELFGVFTSHLLSLDYWDGIKRGLYDSHGF